MSTIFVENINYEKYISFQKTIHVHQISQRWRNTHDVICLSVIEQVLNAHELNIVKLVTCSFLSRVNFIMVSTVALR